MTEVKRRKTKVESKEDTSVSLVNQKTIIGTVVSVKNKSTVNVSILRFVRHPIYGKSLRRTHTLLAHNSGVVCKEGDSVSIQACRPISKRKHYTVIEKIG
jgi:small subunit ribosomal protein S17